MDDPAKNPYAAGSTTPGGRFPAAQGLGTINAAATTGTMIGLSLIGGLVFIAGIMSFLTFSDPPEDQSLLRFDADAIVMVGVGYVFFFGSATAAVVLRSQMKTRAIEQFKASEDELPRPLKGDSALPLSAQRFLGAIATYTLIGQALFEGPAVFNAILMMTDDNLAHAIPVVIGIVGIALQIPTAGKLTSLMEDAKL